MTRLNPDTELIRLQHVISSAEAEVEQLERAERDTRLKLTPEGALKQGLIARLKARLGQLQLEQNRWFAKLTQLKAERRRWQAERLRLMQKRKLASALAPRPHWLWPTVGHTD